MSVFVVGALHLDVIVDAPRLPRLDETLMGNAVTYRLGGKGGNQAVAAARLGSRVAMAGCVGDDAFGATLRGTLASAGVDHARVRTVEGASGMSVAIVDAAGEYGAVVVSAANLLLRAEDTALPPDTRVLCLQNEIAESINIAVARRARAMGALVLLNAAPARAMAPELLSLADILVVNRVEAEDLVGAHDPQRQVALLQSLGPRTVVLTLGGAGLVWAGDGAGGADPAFAVPVISTHGAGDVMVGALACALALGAPVADALPFAQAAAALHISTAGQEQAALSDTRVAAFLSDQVDRR